MELKEILLSLRREKGLSQAELAEELGVSRQAVSRWEAGLAVPSGENLIALSRVYGVTVEEMLRNGRGEEPPPEGGDTPKRKWPRKRIVLAALLVGLYLLVYIWGILANSRALATGYLIFFTFILLVGVHLYGVYCVITYVKQRMRQK